MNTRLIYAGIGSRETPIEMIELMIRLGFYLGKIGWTLRSGGADGADKAFEDGCDEAYGEKQIFLPWKGFNNSSSEYFELTQESFEIAKNIHKAWNYLKDSGKRLHARNVYQVLGCPKYNHTSSDIVICWTPNGEAVGGTATAINLALKNNIPVLNLFGNKLSFHELITKIYSEVILNHEIKSRQHSV